MAGWINCLLIAVLLMASWCQTACGDVAAPSLDTIFPTGCTAGSTVLLELTGKNLSGLKRLHASIPGSRCAVKDETHCEVTIPSETLPGTYDVWAITEAGVSSPRSFVVSQRTELMESGENDNAGNPQSVSLNVVINGRIEQPGDQDHFRFEARQGQQVILDCRAERIDSRLRAVLEVFDAQGRRLAVNRGYHGIDPQIVFRVPSDGFYLAKIHDLVFSGGAEHEYRLELDAGPRVAYTVPHLLTRGKSQRITIFGWNLSANDPSARLTDHAESFAGGLERLDVEIPAESVQDAWPLPFRLAAPNLVADGFAYHHPGSNSCILMGIAEDSVTWERNDNHNPASAQSNPVPSDVGGSLVRGDEQDWYAIDVQRGEVLYFDLLSQRLGAPTDLQLSVWDANGTKLLADWNDEPRNLGGMSFPTNHLDSSGRWVAPATGRYLLMIGNLNAGSQFDHRRSYRLQVRREEPDMQLYLVPRNTNPEGLNVRKGGRVAFDVLALRQSGMQDAIKISARNLPIGMECPPIVLGSGVDRGTMTISANASVGDQVFSLVLEGEAESVGKRPVHGTTVIRAGTPNGWSRLTSEIPVAVAGAAPVRLTARILEELDHHLYGHLKLRYSPGMVLDVAVTVEQRDAEYRPSARLIGVGLPPLITQQSTTMAAGQTTSVLSFFLPPTLPLGQYSLAISAETTTRTADQKLENVTIVSNPITFTVEPAAFDVSIDPFSPRRVRRGETFEVKYAAVRKHGFIGKIHTELACPGIVTDIPGLRGRGVTFVGQSDQGAIQIQVNDDAQPGTPPALRLFAVGVVEDQPMYYGSVLLPLEITE